MHLTLHCIINSTITENCFVVYFNLILFYFINPQRGKWAELGFKIRNYDDSACLHSSSNLAILM